jgi:hypothetical protein
VSRRRERRRGVTRLDGNARRGGLQTPRKTTSATTSAIGPRAVGLPAFAHAERIGKRRHSEEVARRAENEEERLFRQGLHGALLDAADGFATVTTSGTWCPA